MSNRDSIARAIFNAMRKHYDEIGHAEFGPRDFIADEKARASYAFVYKLADAVIAELMRKQPEEERLGGLPKSSATTPERKTSKPVRRRI